jgi:hypothetical protein
MGGEKGAFKEHGTNVRIFGHHLLCQVDQAGLQAIKVVVPYAVKHLLHLGKDLGARYDDLGCIVNPTVRKGRASFKTLPFAQRIPTFFPGLSDFKIMGICIKLEKKQGVSSWLMTSGR